MTYFNRNSLLRGCAASIGALFLAALAAQSQTSASGTPAAGMAQESMPKSGADQTHSSMMMEKDGMSNMKMTGDADKDFAMMMKMHHQKAIEMANKELSNGKSPAMKSMAKRIIAAQEKEIAEFDAWLIAHK